ncbi:MAG: YggT family protein [Clostridia bacterium]|nr:YggT family protein [Clostridia bacterium]
MAGVAYVLYSILYVLGFVMLLRVLISMFAPTPDNPVLYFVCLITEPFVFPVRLVFDFFGAFEDVPFDAAFFVSYAVVLLSAVFCKGMC